MKKLFSIVFFVLFYLHGLGGYYYYRGEKTPIKINSDSATIYVQTSTRKNDIEIHSYTIAKDEIPKITTNDDIPILSIEYIVGDTSLVKMSNCFYVQLKEYADTIILKALVEETNSLLLGEVPYIDKWYKIMVANSTINNSLELSNYFYETGYFADIDPGFIINYAPNSESSTRSDTRWALNEIKAYDAWNITRGNRDIRIAIVDQGIDNSHIEFTGTNFLYSYDCYTHREINTTYGEHGTFIAGIICANHNYGILSGVVPNASLISISHPIDGDNMSEELAIGIRWAVLRGADVINCSWGDQGGIYYNQMHSALLESVLLDAATEGRQGKGCIVVFASGNKAESGLPIDYPGRFTPEMLVVGAMNSNNERASHSAYGRTLDVLAPGDNIYSSVLNNQYKNDGGTSYAAGYVSGIAALILSINPNLTREEVVNIIETTAQKVGEYDYSPTEGRTNGKWHEEMGYGLVDAYAAVLAARNTIHKINGPEILSTQSTYSVTNVPAGASVEWTYTFTPSNPLSQEHKVWDPIVFVNGNSTSSVLLKRGKYPVPRDTITPTPTPLPPGINSINSSLTTFVYFSGTAVLKATITSGGYSYSITKTITLSSSSTTALALEIEEETDNIIEDSTNLLNSAPLPLYNLRHINPISSSNAIICIEKLLDSSSVYIPNDDNYTIEIWHHQLGLIKRVCDNTSILNLDCGDLPTGVYQMILIINGEPVAQSKLIKL